MEAFTFSIHRCEKPSLSLPLKVFEASPPYGNKLIAVQVAFPTSTSTSLVWSGALYGYRGRFDDAHVPLATIEEGSDREYVRVFRDVALPAQAAQLLEIFGERVLRDAVCLCSLVAAPETGSPSEDFLRSLQALPYLHWH